MKREIIFLVFVTIFSSYMVNRVNAQQADLNKLENALSTQNKNDKFDLSLDVYNLFKSGTGQVMLRFKP